MIGYVPTKEEQLEEQDKYLHKNLPIVLQAIYHSSVLFLPLILRGQRTTRRFLSDGGKWERKLLTGRHPDLIPPIWCKFVICREALSPTRTKPRWMGI